MKTPFELMQQYRSEIGKAPFSEQMPARIGGHGDIIIDRHWGEDIEAWVNSGRLHVIDPDYLQWLEEKALQQIQEMYIKQR